MDEKRFRSIRRLNWAFVALIVLSIGVYLCFMFQALFGHEFAITLPTVKGLQRVVLADLSWRERVTVLAICSLPDFCWLFGAAQLAMLARLFHRGEVFSVRVIRRISWFGAALFAMAITEAVNVVSAAAYLNWCGRTDPLEKPLKAVFYGGSFNSLLAAVLVLIVARIMRIAVELDQEAKWTV